MQKSSVAAFLATVLVAVPAGWRLLDANIQTDGPQTRPPKESFEVDGATVSVEIDRGIGVPGGKVKATIVATSDTPKEISLDVRALEDNGYGEERVQNPPTVISKKRVKVKAAPGGGTPLELAYTLGTVRRKGAVQWFDIEVASAKGRPTAGDDDEVRSAASVGFAVWGGNSFPITLTAPAITASGPFDVVVTIKNTKKKAIDWLEVELGAQVSLEGLSSELMVNSYGEDVPYEIERTDFEGGEAPFEPGEQRQWTFRVTPKSGDTRSFTLMAHAHGGGAGAVEVMTFQRPAAADAAPVVGLASEQQAPLGRAK